MVLRKPNLLDAFQASAPEGKRAPPSRPAASAAGPFAQVSAPKPAGNRRSLGAQMASDRLVQFAVVVCLVGVGIAYYVGRSSSRPDSTQAAGETPSGGRLVRETPAGTAATSDPVEANRKAAALSTSEHDKAFFDPKYRFTVRVSGYVTDEAGKKAAFADRDYLRGEALPVVGPILNEGKYIVCVGYTATLDELEKYLEFVKKLRGPKTGRKNPYASAYADNISNVVARK